MFDRFQFTSEVSMRQFFIGRFVRKLLVGFSVVVFGTPNYVITTLLDMLSSRGRRFGEIFLASLSILSCDIGDGRNGVFRSSDNVLITLSSCIQN